MSPTASRFRSAAGVIAIMLAPFAPASGANDQAPALVRAYLASTAELLPAPARSALRRINDTPRQLLAARAYVRAGELLIERWSWSDKQMEDFTSSRQYRELLDEVARVRAAFAAQNPGYTLGASTQARSVDVQIRRWNQNVSVGRAADSLSAAAITELRTGAYPAAPNPRAVGRFMEFLRAWRPSMAASLAAPGLSLHGQLRAIDFHVEKAGRIVAGTQIASVRSVWEQQGWARKLQLAIANSRFVGPLQSPNEPWHYEYAPAK